MKAISLITTISQGHLNIWERCRREYQYRYLEELNLPEADLVGKQNLLLGANFHLLMQQKEMGLDVAELAGSHANLQSWLAAFEQQPPAMIAGDRLCEHRRTLEVSANLPMSLHHIHNHDHGQGCFVLTAIYDLLILGDRQGQILDWKTHQVAISKAKLQKNWQTRLYLYLLAKTTNYAPEEISMTYWFANAAESVIINYSQADFDQTERQISQILTEIRDTDNYPKLLSGNSNCRRCEFRDRCDRGEPLGFEFSSSIADIAEIEI
ncbi:MAG: hypothetical protein AUK48_03080 [Oscillatoriales cyanobacterium CG2_30_44_21]|nr:MAG: hypothetical protein AUK48_03080 [Oscillatoriales cyanobacterium CG2_30_44_21]